MAHRLAAALLVTSLLCTSCGTIFTRSQASYEDHWCSKADGPPCPRCLPRPYSGSLYDVVLFPQFVFGSSPAPPSNAQPPPQFRDQHERAEALLGVTLLVLIEPVLSLTADTILLPYTGYMQITQGSLCCADGGPTPTPSSTSTDTPTPTPTAE